MAYEKGRARSDALKANPKFMCVDVDLNRANLNHTDTALAMMEMIGPTAGEIMQIDGGVFTFCFDADNVEDVIYDISSNESFVKDTVEAHRVLKRALKNKFPELRK